jgi:hypothetical protein
VNKQDKAYLTQLDTVLNRSASSMNLSISALKFFYKAICKRDIVSTGLVRTNSFLASLASLR